MIPRRQTQQPMTTATRFLLQRSSTNKKINIKIDKTGKTINGNGKKVIISNDWL